MQSINKIHVNNSTKLSLNDRFTIIQTGAPKPPPSRRNNRSRSTSRTRLSDRTAPKASIRNQKFLERLDQKHKLRAALRLKRKSVRTNLPPRQRLTNRARNRVAIKRGFNALSVGTNGRLKRANSLTNIQTMQADLIGSSLARSNSATNLAGRLGVRQQIGGKPRGRLNRSSFTTLRRSNSRQNLTRSNSQTNLRRTNSQTNMRRSNSRQNLSLIRSHSRPNISAQRSRLSRANSRNNLSRQNLSINQNRPINNRRNRSQIRPRSNSTNNKLGVNRSNTVAARRGPIIRGRVFKRKNSNVTNQNGNRVDIRAQQRLGRSRSRVAQTNRRNRSLSRNRNNRQGNNNNINLQPNRSRNVRGRGRSRSRGQGRGISAKNLPPKTKEELDKELDQYMVNTKSQNDLDNIMGVL